MRLTDDYLIISDSQLSVEKVVSDLFICSNQHNFEFNLKKLKSNFSMKNFQLEENL